MSSHALVPGVKPFEVRSEDEVQPTTKMYRLLKSEALHPSQLPCEAEPVSTALQVDEEQSVGDQLAAGGRMSCANPSPKELAKLLLTPYLKSLERNRHPKVPKTGPGANGK